MFRLSLTVFVLLCWHILKAQNDTLQHHISLDIGLQIHQSQDLIYSPMIYRGQSLASFQFMYSYHTRKGIHQLRSYYDHVNTESTELISFPGFGEDNQRSLSPINFIEAEYSYLHRIRSIKSLALLAGGSLSTLTQLPTYQFGFGDEEGFIIAHALKLKVMTNIKMVERHSLRIETSYPLLSMLVRPLYSIVDNGLIQNEGSDFAYLHNHGSLEGPGGYHHFHFLAKYIVPFSEKTELNAGYLFQYIRYKDPQQISILKNTLTIGINLKF